MPLTGAAMPLRRRLHLLRFQTFRKSFLTCLRNQIWSQKVACARVFYGLASCHLLFNFLLFRFIANLKSRQAELSGVVRKKP